MDISQSTQIFLLYVAICLIILIALYFLFSRNKQEKLSLINAVQTSILVVGFLSLIVFGSSYYFVLSDVDPSRQPLKDALSITASFFGGFATLTAAYIASRMFNKWEDQKQYEIIHNYIVSIKSRINDLQQFIFTNRTKIALYNNESKLPETTDKECWDIWIKLIDIEKGLVDRSAIIHMEMNELYYIRFKKPKDPLSVELTNKMLTLQELGFSKENFGDFLANRKSSTVLNDYYLYLTNDFSTFIYDDILSKYLDDLILTRGK